MARSAREISRFLLETVYSAVGNCGRICYFCLKLKGFLWEGRWLPYFFAMISAEVREKIETTLSAAHPEVFVVDASYTKSKRSVLSLKVDTDHGISLEQCTAVSRTIGRMLDENEHLISGPFHLEVSSPGIGYPLKLWRQYPQNLGRHLEVKDLEGHSTKGKLIDVQEETFTLELLPEKRKKKSKKKEAQTAPEAEETTRTYAFDQIETAKVIIV